MDKQEVVDMIDTIKLKPLTHLATGHPVIGMKNLYWQNTDDSYHHGTYDFNEHMTRCWIDDYGEQFLSSSIRSWYQEEGEEEMIKITIDYGEVVQAYAVPYSVARAIETLIGRYETKAIRCKNKKGTMNGES